MNGTMIKIKINNNWNNHEDNNNLVVWDIKKDDGSCRKIRIKRSTVYNIIYQVTRKHCNKQTTKELLKNEHLKELKCQTQY